MNVEVSIERDPDGRLHGFVIERYEDRNGDELVRKGSDMLAKRIYKYVSLACSECASQLHGKNKTSILNPLEIKFIYLPGNDA